MNTFRRFERPPLKAQPLSARPCPRSYPGISIGGFLAVCAMCAMCVKAFGAAQETDSGWPRAMTNNGNRVEIFQPQLESWQDNHLQARAVVEVTVSGYQTPSLGVAWFNADTLVDKTQRLVTLQNVSISRVQFSVVAQEQADMLAVARNALPLVGRTIALDRLTMASLVAQSQSKRGAVSFKHDPPMVIWTTNAVAALVLIDGDPVLRPVPNSALLRVINTAALILFNPSGGTYYLAGQGVWFQSEGIAGPWSVAANPPDAVSRLTPPAEAAANSPNSPGPESPVVYVSTKPAELLQTDGKPAYKTEEGSGLMYLANSDSQVLYNPEGGTVFILLSGRWFKSQGSLGGPWTYVAPKDLPQSFSQFDEAGPKAMLLSSVPGTPQAASAHLASSRPQTATIQRGGASYEVQYDGPPQFKPIQGTSLQYALNAAEPVILCQNRYYSVGNAVWFVADSPTGPWAVAASVPQDIYSIPSSSPLYYVTYVYITHSDTNEVESAYLPGYVGSYDDQGQVAPVYGTGYYYPPWTGAYYYGWGLPYGYDYQYRWWRNNWLWRPPWNRVGNLYAVNAARVYDRWPRAAANGAYVARASADRALGVGYPTMYGRYAGAVAAVPMRIPPRAALANPYARLPGNTAEVVAESLKVGSAEARDLYATPDGSIYRRQEGKWYRAEAGGRWGYVAPAVGPPTHPYHPATAAYYQHPAAYSAAAASRVDRPPETAALDRDYDARATAERSYQDYRPEYRGRR